MLRSLWQASTGVLIPPLFGFATRMRRVNGRVPIPVTDRTTSGIGNKLRYSPNANRWRKCRVSPRGSRAIGGNTGWCRGLTSVGVTARIGRPSSTPITSGVGCNISKISRSPTRRHFDVNMLPATSNGGRSAGVSGTLRFTRSSSLGHSWMKRSIADTRP